MSKSRRRFHVNPKRLSPLPSAFIFRYSSADSLVVSSKFDHMLRRAMRQPGPRAFGGDAAICLRRRPHHASFRRRHGLLGRNELRRRLVSRSASQKIRVVSHQVRCNLFFFFAETFRSFCLTVVLKLVVTVFLNLYYQTFWPN